MTTLATVNVPWQKSTEIGRQQSLGQLIVGDTRILLQRNVGYADSSLHAKNQLKTYSYFNKVPR